MYRHEPNAPAGVCFSAAIARALSRLGVDQVLGQRADDAVAAGVDLADAVLVLARRLDDAGGARVDDGGHAAGLGVEGVASGHGIRSVSSSARRGRRRGSTRRRPCPSTLRYFGARGSPVAAQLGVILDQRLRLRVVDLEALAHGFLAVVDALDQVLARDVVLPGHARRVVAKVVGAPRSAGARGARSSARRWRCRARRSRARSRPRRRPPAPHWPAESCAESRRRDSRSRNPAPSGARSPAPR